MDASQLPENESFRQEFVQHCEQVTHRARLDNNLVAKTIVKLCACHEVKEKLLIETNKHHAIGKKAKSQQKYDSYDHIGLIDAACDGANKTKYSTLEQIIIEKDKTIKKMNEKVCFDCICRIKCIMYINFCNFFLFLH